MSASADSVMQVQLKPISRESKNLNSYELVSPIGGDLAPFAAGPIVKAARRGIPDHRELFLSKEEQEANKTNKICCSGSKSASLTVGI